MITKKSILKFYLFMYLLFIAMIIPLGLIGITHGDWALILGSLISVTVAILCLVRWIKKFHSYYENQIKF